MSIEDKFTPYAIIPKPRLDLSIGGGGGSLGMGGGGRVGIDIPMNNANLNVGVSGQGYYMPKQGKGDFKATGIDASFVQGENELRLKYEQMSPEEKQLVFNFIKSF